MGTIKAVNPTDKWKRFWAAFAALFLGEKIETRKIAAIHFKIAKLCLCPFGGKYREYKLTLNESSEPESPVSGGFFSIIK